MSEEGIRKFRIETSIRTRSEIVIFTEEHYGIFDIQELMVLVGKPPLDFTRGFDPKAFKKEHGIT